MWSCMLMSVSIGLLDKATFKISCITKWVLHTRKIYKSVHRYIDNEINPHIPGNCPEIGLTNIPLVYFLCTCGKHSFPEVYTFSAHWCIPAQTLNQEALVLNAMSLLP